jgi:hypothetical protein
MLFVKPTCLSVTICLCAIRIIIHLQVYADLQSFAYICKTKQPWLEFEKSRDTILPNVLRISLPPPPPPGPLQMSERYFKSWHERFRPHPFHPIAPTIKLSETTFLETRIALINKLHKRRQDVFSHPYVRPSNMKHDVSVGSPTEFTEHIVWDLCILVVRYGHFGTIYRCPLQGSSSLWRWER